MTRCTPTITTALALAALLAVAAAPAFAQGRPGGGQRGRRGGRGPLPPAAQPDEGKPVSFKLENASLETVIDLLSKKLNISVVKIDDDAKSRLKGKKITAVSNAGLTRSQAIRFLNTALAEHKVTLVRVQDTVTIMTQEKAAKHTFTITRGIDPQQIPFGDEVITHIVPLKYAIAEDIKKELNDLLDDDAELLYNARSNSLVVTGKATSVRRFVTIMHEIDTQLDEGMTIKRFKLNNADATDVARVIQEVFAPPGGSNANNNRRGGRRRGGFMGMISRFMGRGGSNQAQGTSPMAEVKASVEERTNSVIVSAAAELMPQIEALVLDMDKDEVPEPVTRVFPIRNADAANVAQILNQLFAQNSNNSRARNGNTNNRNNNNPFARFFGGGNNNRNRGGGNARGGNNRSRGRGRSDTDFGPAAPGFAMPAMQDTAPGANRSPQQPARPQEPGVSGPVDIQADGDSNSVVVRTDPENVDSIRRIINELDQVRAQVLVKCFICEVTLDDESSLGVEWDWNDSLHVRKTPGTGQAGSNFDLTSSARSVGFQYQLLSENIDLFIQGLKKNGKLKVLSAPRILALDNEEAEINVGRQVPFIRNTRITQDGQTVNTVEYEDIGIILQVTPHVNTAGQVRLELAPEVSEVAPESESIQITEGVLSPVFVTTTATTTVSVQNNQTVVIGGLIRDRWSKSQSKVPFLGDIPLIGLLFQDEKVEKTRTELMIFLTPVVITKPHDLELLTRDEVLALDLITNAFFEKHVLQDGVPSMEKRLMVLRKGTADLDE